MNVLVETAVNSASYFKLVLSHQFDAVGRKLPRARKDSGILPIHIRRAVLIIPGFLGPRAVVHPFEVWFDRAHVPAFSFNLGLVSTLPMSLILKLLEQRIQRVRGLYPYLERIDVVGHSMGGIIGLEAIEKGIFDGFEVRLVGLGAPFRGTPVAYAGWFIPGAAELLPIHPRYWLWREWPRVRNIPFLSIAGEMDILAPPERCRHPLASFSSLPFDHAGLILKKAPFQEAFNFLALP